MQGHTAVEYYSGRNIMPGRTKIFLAAGATTTVRFGFCDSVVFMTFPFQIAPQVGAREDSNQKVNKVLKLAKLLSGFKNIFKLN
jgi:hypothetical protein